MKIIVQIARVLTGLLFIFSGVIKLNDPSGFSIKLNEYFDIFAQDVSAKQDTLKLSLLDGTTDLGTKSFVLYSFDNTKEINIETDFLPRKDTSGKILDFDANIELSLDAETVADHDFSLPDSSAISSFGVKASIGGKAIFTKSYQAGVSRPLSETQNVNVVEYVKKEGWLFNFFKGMKNHTLWLSIFICALEVILGFALIVGWQIRLTAWLLLLLIVFFTFLTFYAAFFNKVTDCGCFGDFIKLKPWESFDKDLILLVLILIIFFGKKHIKPWFSKKFGWKFMSFISLISLGFGIFCYTYLPLWDFLPYKKGNDILKIMTEVPAGMRSTDSVVMVYTMHKGKDSVDVPYISPGTELMKRAKDGWEYGKRVDKVIIEGYKSPIHDFAIRDAVTGVDRKDSLLTYDGFQLVWVMTYTDKAYQGANKEIKELYKWSSQRDMPFMALTATSTEPAMQYVKKEKLDFQFFSSDQKMLMTMARYNPTLYLLNGSVVVDKWSGRNLPSTKKLEKLVGR